MPFLHGLSTVSKRSILSIRADIIFSCAEYIRSGRIYSHSENIRSGQGVQRHGKSRKFEPWSHPSHMPLAAKARLKDHVQRKKIRSGQSPRNISEEIMAAATGTHQQIF